MNHEIIELLQAVEAYLEIESETAHGARFVRSVSLLSRVRDVLTDLEDNAGAVY